MSKFSIGKKQLLSIPAILSASFCVSFTAKPLKLFQQQHNIDLGAEFLKLQRKRKEKLKQSSFSFLKVIKSLYYRDLLFVTNLLFTCLQLDVSNLCNGEVNKFHFLRYLRCRQYKSAFLVQHMFIITKKTLIPTKNMNMEI